MKSRIKTGFFSAAVAALFMVLTLAANPARAAVPELVNFQGKLTDSAGTPVTTSVPMVFKFYTTATGGSLVWTETQDVIPDLTGLYSVLLGSSTPFSAYNISFSTAYWLGVTVGTDLEMTPRFKIVSSAYALYSINSGTAAYSVNSGTSAWAGAADWATITNKPSFGAGDVYLASTQTFTGENIFKSGTYFSSSTYLTGGGIYSTGAIGGVPFSGSGTRFMWIPEKYAIRAGNVTGTQWDSGNIGDYSVAFGYNNTASFFYDSVAGGTGNTASGGGGSIAGGTGNNVTGGYASIAGGSGNTATSNYSAVAGGWNNTAGGTYSTVGGGNQNTAAGGGGSTIAGGWNNTANGVYATVTGGGSNTANGTSSIVVGGSQNTAKSDYSFAAGRKSSSTAIGAFTWSDSEGVLVDNDVVDRTWFKNRGGFLITNNTNAAAAAFSVDGSGYVGVGTMLVPSTFTVVGTFKLIDGSAAAGRVLTSDANGLARWQTAAAGGDVYLASTQTFTGANTFTSTAAFTALDPSLPGLIISSGLVVSAGSVGIGINVPTSTLTVIGTFKLVDGSQGVSKVLTSDTNGLASWQTAGTGGDVYKASTQTFTGENTFMANTYFSSSAYFTNGGIYSTGTVGGVPFSGAGTRFMWIPQKSAIRAGVVTGGQWNIGSIGLGSVAFGNDNTASNTYTTVAGGQNNTASGLSATVAGGEYNLASGEKATVAGGLNNTANNQYATVSGGFQSTASGQYSTVAGGVQNTASGIYAIVAGGYNNSAGNRAAVAGGESNRASDTYAAIAGGYLNTASAYAATVAGGQGNTASNTYATVAGGDGNTANGAYSFAAGRASSSTVEGTFTWADSDGTQVDNNVFNRTWFKNRGGFLVTASTNPLDGGLFLNTNNYVGIGTLVPTSTLTVIGTFKLVDGTQTNGYVLTSNAAGLANWQAPSTGGDVYKASTQTFTGENTFRGNTYFSSSAYFTNGGIYSTGTVGGVAFSGAGTRLMWVPEKGAIRAGIVAGTSWDSNNIGLGSVAFGNNSTSSNTYTTVSGGTANSAGGYTANVGGGQSNIASGDRSTVSGGETNTASGLRATVAGGQSNTASNLSATVSGGYSNTASGSFSSMGGGQGNLASNSYSTVAGGQENTANGQYAIVAGGRLNTANSNDTTVAGGQSNTASASAATVAGGSGNTASGSNSTVTGGAENTAKGNYSFAAGYRSSSTVDGAFTWSDSEGTQVDNTVANRTWFKNKGGFLTTASTNTADGGLFLSSANRLGVGNTNPQYQLDVTGDMRVSKRAIYTPSAVNTITDTVGITAAMLNNKIIRIQGNGGPVDITADPAIAPGVDGQIIILAGMDSTNSVIVNSDTGVALDTSQPIEGTLMTLERGSTLELMYDATMGYWIEIGRSYNVVP